MHLQITYLLTSLQYIIHTIHTIHTKQFKFIYIQSKLRITNYKLQLSHHNNYLEIKVYIITNATNTPVTLAPKSEQRFFNGQRLFSKQRLFLKIMVVGLLSFPLQ